MICYGEALSGCVKKIIDSVERNIPKLLKHLNHLRRKRWTKILCLFEEEFLLTKDRLSFESEKKKRVIHSMFYELRSRISK